MVTGPTHTRRLAAAFISSLIYQILQVGTFPLFLSQRMLGKDFESWAIGVSVAISWLAVLVCGPFVPRFIRRFGYRGAVAFSFVLTGIGFVALSLSTALPVIVVSASMVGTALIVRWIAFDALVVELAGDERRGTVIGLHEALMGFGIAIGPMFFVVLPLSMVGYACAALAVIGQLIFFGVPFTATAGEPEHGSEPVHRHVLRLLAFALCAAFVAGFVESTGIALFAVHYQNIGFSLSTAALMVSAFGLGGTLLQPPLGTIADRYGYKTAHALCVAAAVASAAVMITASANMPLIAAASFVLGGAAGGFNTLAVIEAGSMGDARAIPFAMTAVAMAYTIGGVIGPSLGGTVMTAASNHGLIWLFIAVVGALGLLMAAHRQRRRPGG
ncbi:MAG: MFS transporter [Brucellaceae bacterium]|nr:MFS transporter [Brucellaceae bacterium]